jgi:hypothetical protein
MARTVRETTLATRSARLRLAIANKPYWRVIEQGLHLGYRRRATGGSWIARRRNEEGTYRESKLGLADDLQDVDGKTIGHCALSRINPQSKKGDEDRRHYISV